MSIYKRFLKLTAILVITLLSHSCNKESTPSSADEKLSDQKPQAMKRVSATQELVSDADVKIDRSVRPQKELTAPEVTAATPAAPVASDQKSDLAGPKPGEKIYTWDNIPEVSENGCSEYWVKDTDGKIIKIHMCKGHD